MKSTIITIGDEILIGQILDTNSRYISQELNKIGVVVGERVSIGDDAEQIASTLQRALEKSQIIIITGGLGPTKDDITKHTLSKFFSSKLVYNQMVADHVERLLARRGIAFNDLNRSQAEVPECCTVLFNAHGTAPGMWFDEAGKVVVSLPGVPFEMQHLMEEEVLPRLRKQFTLKAIVHRTMITAGVAESILAERIAKWEEALPKSLKLAYLPAPNIVRLRLSAYEVDGEKTEEIIEREFEKLYAVIPEAIVGFEQATVQELVHKILIDRQQTLAVAESCTGGTIASLFTAMSGASTYFRAGVVSYSNEAKVDILGVSAEDIKRYGAVSEQVARQMAEGVRRISGSTYALATTGIAGPTGGTAEKPIGTLWFALATPAATYALKRDCGTDRGQVISRASAYAIEMLYKELNNSPKQ